MITGHLALIARTARNETLGASDRPSLAFLALNDVTLPSKERFDQTGAFAIAWEGELGVLCLRRFDRRGAAKGPALVVDGGVNMPTVSALAMQANGSLVVAWDPCIAPGLAPAYTDGKLAFRVLRRSSSRARADLMGTRRRAMTAMKNLKAVLLGAATAVLAGCVVTSVYPFYTEKDLFFEPALVGDWIKQTKDSDHEVWKFEKSGDLAYRFTLIETSRATVTEAHTFKLQGQLFLDVASIEQDYHVIPPHYLWFFTSLCELRRAGGTGGILPG